MHCSKAYSELTSLPPPVLNVILTSMCLLSTYDHFSLHALSKGGAFFTHNKETTTTTNFFLQIFLFLSTLFLPILHYHFSWGNGEEIINCVFLWRALLMLSKRWSPSTAPISLLPIACSSLSLPIYTLSSNE